MTNSYSAPPPPAPQNEAPFGPAPLWAPQYGASFGVAFSRFWKKYATFDGRASRSEYWWWQLANALVGIVIGVIALIGYFAGGHEAADGSWTPGTGWLIGVILGALWWLATLIPGIALTVRRLHDGNFAGWFYFLVLVPSVGGIIILVFTLLPPNPLGQRFDRPA